MNFTEIGIDVMGIVMYVRCVPTNDLNDWKM